VIPVGALSPHAFDEMHDQLVSLASGMQAAQIAAVAEMLFESIGWKLHRQEIDFG
jgi:hypothetical protein